MEAVGESRIAATHRLQREGRWDEASRYRDEVRRELRSEGKKRADANDGAWAAMLEEFPPLTTGTVAGKPAEPEDDLDLEPLLAKLNGKAPDLPEDVLWVYTNLANKRAIPNDAPGPGAWALLSWARSNKDHFFQQMLPKAMTVVVDRKGTELDGAAGLAADKTHAEILKMLASVRHPMPDVAGREATVAE